MVYWKKRDRPPEAVTAVAAIGSIDSSVLASGTIQPRTMVNVGAQASGRIVALHVTLGDHVAKGALVAEIDPSTQRNALQIAEASLDQDRAQRASRAMALKQAELAFKRAQVMAANRLARLQNYTTLCQALGGDVNRALPTQP